MHVGYRHQISKAKYLRMSIGNIMKLQENTVALCKMAVKVSGYAIRGSGYVWSGKLKRPPLPSGVRRWIRNIRMEWWQRRFRIWDIRVECWQSRIPDVRHPGGMSAVQNSGCENKIEDDKKPSSGVSGHLLPRIPKNSPQSLIALVIKKLSKHQNLTQFD